MSGSSSPFSLLSKQIPVFTLTLLFELPNLLLTEYLTSTVIEKNSASPGWELAACVPLLTAVLFCPEALLLMPVPSRLVAGASLHY